VDVALLFLTAALVVATGVYSWFTRLMAREMKETRLFSFRPRLALDLKVIAPHSGVVVVRSLGPGPAVDVRVTVTYQPSGARKVFLAPVLVPGQSNDFFPIGASGAPALELDDLASQGVVVGLVGTMLDAYGDQHSVDETLVIAEWWDAVKQADRLSDTPADERIAKETGEDPQGARKALAPLMRCTTAP
jgi:hypothetical protein